MEISLSKSGSLFSKVALLLSMSMGMSAWGAYVGRDFLLNSWWLVLGMFVLAILGLFAVKIATAVSRPLGVVALSGWTFFMGLMFGPGLKFYVAALGWETVAFAFLGTAGIMSALGAFGALSGRDFSGMGKWLMIALFGLIIAGIVNIFVSFGHIGTLLYSGIGMLVFAGYFVYDFFRISKSENTWAAAIDATIELFLDFWNFLWYLLRFILEMQSKK